MGGPGPFGVLPALLFVGLVVALVLLFVRGRVGPIRFTRGTFGGGAAGATGWAAHRGAEDAAFETLRMRLAKGDITPEEYLERTSVLRSPQSPTDPKETS